MRSPMVGGSRFGILGMHCRHRYGCNSKLYDEDMNAIVSLQAHAIYFVQIHAFQRATLLQKKKHEN